ncbi:MAG: FprA family A-type flavoprotein [Clostridia bacterium]|nr:FprA family A-type flavoprotein [Clostridia bacterium]
MQVCKDVTYIGVNDRQTDLFEGQFLVPNGMAYNSYLLTDEKIAVFDSVDATFKNVWLNNLDKALNGRTPDYLIVQHMEPDHSGSLKAFAEKYPSAKIVASTRAFIMMKNYFATDFIERQLIAEDGGSLSLGTHVLRFIAAPMVHWPEVFVTYDETSKLLFSADAFGKFGALDAEEDWACEARRYYFGIVGKYGVQVQSLLKKLSNFKISTICPLHGPVLKDNLQYYIDLYNTWSSYNMESEGIFIAYTSVYGNTKKAVEYLAECLQSRGVKVVVTDLARCDMSEAVEDAFRYGKAVLATTTYNGEIFPFMREFLHELTERNYQNRIVGFIENGSWAPMATRVMRTMLEKSKNLQYTTATVKILSAITEENKKQIEALAEELCSL